nr:MAK10-like protein [Tanacetum cinerariifolium]
MGDENPIRTLGDYFRPSHEGYRNTIELPEGNNVVPLRSDTIRSAMVPTTLSTTWKISSNLLLNMHPRVSTKRVASGTLSNPSKTILVTLTIRHGKVTQTLGGDSSKILKIIFQTHLIGFSQTVHSQTAPSTTILKFLAVNQISKDWCPTSWHLKTLDYQSLKPIFKQQQYEITNKIDIILKAITDRMAGALPSDMVKNPKLNVNSTSPVLSASSYPIEYPQCSFRIYSSINTITICLKRPSESQNGKPENEEQEEKDNLKNINTNPSSPPNPSVSFITEKVRKLNSFFELLGLVPQSPETKFVCTKRDDGDVMFIEIIKKNYDSYKEEPEVGENVGVGESEMEYFNIFPTRSALAYHKYLMYGPIPSIFLRNPIIIERCRSNLKIPCNIGHVHIEKAYIDLNSFVNFMTCMLYNWILRRKLNPRENTNRDVNNFTGRINGMHVFVGNFTYVIDFMIVEDISSIIDPRLSQVVLGKPFVEISNMTHDLPEGVVRFINGTDISAYKMPHKLEQYNSLSDLKR